MNKISNTNRQGQGKKLKVITRGRRRRVEVSAPVLFGDHSLFMGRGPGAGGFSCTEGAIRKFSG